MHHILLSITVILTGCLLALLFSLWQSRDIAGARLDMQIRHAGVLASDKIKIILAAVVCFLLKAVFVLLLMSPLAPINQIAQAPGASAPAYLHVDGRWFDASGQPIRLDDVGSRQPLALWPFRDGDVLLSRQDGSLLRCQRDFKQCQPWGSPSLQIKKEFQVLELGNELVALLSRSPARLYLLDADGKQLHQRQVPTTPISMTEHEGRLYLSYLRRREIQSIAIEDNQLSELRREVSFAENAADGYRDSPLRLRRHDGSWWLMLSSGSHRGGLYVLDDDWQLERQIADEQLNDLTDWAFLSASQLLLLRADRSIYRLDLASGELDKRELPKVAAAAQRHSLWQKLYVGSVMALLLCLSALISCYRNRDHPSREKILTQILGPARHKLTIPPPAEATSAPHWLQPTERTIKARKRLLWWHRHRYTWMSALVLMLVLLMLRFFNKDDSNTYLVLLFCIMIATFLLYYFPQLNAAASNARLRIGVDGDQILLRHPDGKISQIDSSEAVFDGSDLLAGRRSLSLFRQIASSAQADNDGRLFESLFDQDATREHLLPVLLHNTPLRSPSWLQREADRRNGRRGLALIQEVSGVALVIFALYVNW